MILCAIAGLAISLAWWLPGSWWCVVLGWLSAIALVQGIRTSVRPFRSAYLTGCICNLLGFYWLYQTISHFGGFPTIAAVAIFAFFVAVSALQFPLAVLFFRALPLRFDALGIRFAIAFTVSEFISVRIFPWQFGHTQLAFVQMTQIADLGGSLLITFMMFWVVGAWSNFGQIRSAALYAGAALVLALGYGEYRYNFFRDAHLRASNPTVHSALVQGNISLEQKHAAQALDTNIAIYQSLTNPIPSPTGDASPTIIAWPETVSMQWVQAGVRKISDDRRLPIPPANTHLIFGSLTFESPQRYFNSAFAILGDGSVQEPYHKRILMPFGEYTPLGSVLPWLAEINSTAAQFTQGHKQTIFTLPMNTPTGAVKVSSLICYEDVVSSLAREASANGAELLFNLTNDAWFGNSVAPYQHHLIAAFRAIENRRYLLRATNTGLTAVVSPSGETTAALTPFTVGVLQAEVVPLTTKTLYTSVVRDIPWWLASIMVLSSLFARSMRWGKRYSESLSVSGL